MNEINTIGIDIAKNVFQLHATDTTGYVVFRRKVTRGALLKFLGSQANCTVAMESCATSNYWGREIEKLGHKVRLIPPAYVKPFVKRHKNDMADAEAITEAAVRPNMRFVEVKTEEQQSHGMIFRTRDLLVRQRTQLINALRGHMAEFGLVAAKGPAQVGKLQKALLSSQNSVPSIVQELANVYCQQIDALSQRISELEKSLKMQAAHEETTRRLQTMPGVGPVTAMAIHAFAPSMENFKRGRDFSAWLGLIPKQYSTGGKERLGHIAKMGQRDIRRLLIIGAMSIINSTRRKAPQAGSWLERMLARKPKIVVAIALANKMARMVWAMSIKKEGFQLSAALR